MTALHAVPPDGRGRSRSPVEPSSGLPVEPRPLPAGFPGAEDDTAMRRYLRALVDGSQQPPACVGRLTLPLPQRWGPGWLGAEVRFADDLTLTPGVVFGGYIACLVDNFAGLAMMTVLPDRVRFLTADIAVRYRAPLVPGAAVQVDAEVRRLSARWAQVQVRFRQHGALATCGEVEQILRRTAE